MSMNLKKLTGLFAQSAANTDLPPPIRHFAAQLTVLTTHLARIDAKVDAEIQAREELDGHTGEIVALLQQQALPAAPAGVADPTAVSDDPEEDAAKAMAEEVQRETAAEVAAIAAKPPAPASITPLRKPNGGKTAEQAS